MLQLMRKIKKSSALAVFALAFMSSFVLGCGGSNGDSVTPVVTFVMDPYGGDTIGFTIRNTQNDPIREVSAAISDPSNPAGPPQVASLEPGIKQNASVGVVIRFNAPVALPDATSTRTIAVGVGSRTSSAVYKIIIEVTGGAGMTVTYEGSTEPMFLFPGTVGSTY